MASTSKAILSLTQETILCLTARESTWREFLQTASQNYKYSFADQLLIFAQRPEAVACAELKFWNRYFGRLVKKGATGIALIDDSSDMLKLRYVFDVADTESIDGITPTEVELWQFRVDNFPVVRARLESSFGKMTVANDIASVLRESAKNAVADRIGSYLAELSLTESQVTNTIQELLENSVWYMLLNRCGFNPMGHLTGEAFHGLSNFDRISTITVLGCAVSDIAETVLREIESAVKNPNRTFANANRMSNNVLETKTTNKGSEENEHNISGSWGLQTAGAGFAEGVAAWQVWQNEEEFSANSQKGTVHHSAVEWRSDGSSVGNGKLSRAEIDRDVLQDGEPGWGDGGAESARSNEMGRAQKQHSAGGGGADNSRPDLQLNEIDNGIDNIQGDGKYENSPSPFAVPRIPSEAEQLSLLDVVGYGTGGDIGTFSLPQQIIDEVLAGGGNKRDSRLRICAYFKKDHSVEDNADFLRQEFGEDSTGFFIGMDKITAGYSADGIRIARGRTSRLVRDSQLVPWEDAARRVRELLDSGQFMQQDELDRVDEWERHDVAARLWNLYRDEFGNIPDRLKEIAITFSYPEEVERIAERLQDESEVKKIADNIRELIPLMEEYAPRFRIFHPPDEVYAAVNDLLLPQLEFRAQENYTFSDTKRFISDDEIEALFVKKASGIEDGRERIYSFFKENQNEKERVDFLKKEYGIGGWGFDGNNEWHDAKGIAYSRGAIGCPYDKILLPWNRVVKIISRLIVEGRYFSDPKLVEKKPVEIVQESVSSATENFRLNEDNFVSNGAKAKFRNNVAAIKILQKIESEGRGATAEEQEVLSRYAGWGGIPQVFDEKNSAWQDEFTELQSLLAADEYSSARASTLNAHYTPPVVIRAMYAALTNMGFKGGNILEPSCGVGHFFGLLPEDLAASRLYGVELDSISGRISRALYPKSNIAVCGFEETVLPDSFFDVAVGNVPFGNYAVADHRYDKHHFLIHDYFFAKTIDKIRPGGLIAFVTSKGTMDKQNSSVRKYIAERAELLGAIRLPNNTFKGAGAEVTADIIFLKKRDRVVEAGADWLHLGMTDNGIAMNQYFIDHPEMVLGEMALVSGPFGNETACLPVENANLSEQLGRAILSIRGEISEPDLDGETANDDSIPADPSVRNFSFTLVDGKIYFRENSCMYHQDVSEVVGNRIRGLIGIRDSVRRLIELQTDEWPDEEIEAEQQKLNRLYDNYTAKYGLLNSRGNSMAFSDDSSYPLLCSLEILDERGNLERKADMFTKRTIKANVKVERVDTAIEALAVSLSERAKVDMTFMASLTEKSADELFAELSGVVYRDFLQEEAEDEPCYVTADEFLSGNIREKLRNYTNLLKEIAEDNHNAAQIQANIVALEKVKPPDLQATEIAVRLGATWLPAEIIQQFMYELLGTSNYLQGDIRVLYSPVTGEWNVTGKRLDRANPKSSNVYGTKRVNAYKIIEDSLNQRDVKVWDKFVDVDGTEKRKLNKKETAIAQAKQEQIKQAFKDWIWQDSNRREELAALYNERFNSLRPREYDGSHLSFSGINPEIALRKHQLDAVAHIIYGGNTLLAHEVGAGKTFEMVAAAMESKRLGLCRKSLVVVPNHITGQFAAEWLQLYPAANILVATERDFETKKRKKFCGRIATGDYDAVIIGHSQLEKIPMSVERQRRILEEQIEEIMEGIREAREANAENYTVKQMEKSRRALETRLKKLNDQSRKDDLVTFEELGVDRLFVDEAHYFKNLFLATKMRNVSGVAQTEAQKSSDLFMKTRYLDEITGGRGTILATGTPISNSMVELYTMQRYLQYDALVRAELIHFDAWASTYGETTTAIELAPEGSGYRAKTRFAKFYNLPELMSMFRCVADIQTADMLKLPVPKVIFHTEVIEPTELQREMVAALAERAEIIHAGGVDPSIDNMLKVTNDGRKLALDQRLINPLLSDDEGSKTAVCAHNVFKIWQKTKAQKSSQLVFCDLSTPKDDDSFNIYDDLRDKLRRKGIPAEEIAFIHEAKTKAKKMELFAKVRRGDVRVLIGSTQKMGAGTNVQDKLIALHDMDCPWRPADLQQRLGRIVRQGNQNAEVEVYRYVTEGTFDSYLYQLVENKQKFIAQIMTSKAPVRAAEDVDETALSYVEIKALASGNPFIIEKSNLEMEVNKLNLLKSSHLSQQYELEDKVLKYYPREIGSLNVRIAGLIADMQQVSANTPADKTKFSGIEINGVVYTEKATAGKAIVAACQKVRTMGRVELGHYRGLAMELEFRPLSGLYELTLKGTLSYRVELGGDVFGNITRIDNVLVGMDGVCNTAKMQLAEAEKNLELAKRELGKPFLQEEELAAKNKRLAELNVMLNLDEQDSILFDSEEEPIVDRQQNKETAR